MANNQIKVNLLFGADTSRAKSSLQALQADLNKLNQTINQASVTNGMTQQLQQASIEAAKLQTALHAAINPNTQKFDLSKFQSQLKNSGTSLEQLRTSFQSMGAQGQQTFLSLANSIVSAEIPMRRTNSLLQSFGTSLMNVAKWQISSSITRGLYTAVQTAFNYAEDLNRSLNDIRIVTGYSTDKMQAFAKEAGKAARELSATTNEYAKASLIFFQQGLSDKEVKERANITVKLANVTQQSMEEVSSYMTAVWNNFYDGSKSLESYADAITALGAATASSSEEIATGLQKFAAVANTVGLSYEYATAALATVTAQTRESAETVGTAFKTIFARLESLSLGETLDDDTTMTKYSAALASVGVQIKDSNGALKDMDQIVNELGQRWQLLSKDQQVALAQTVAGMRQYNNFLALFANYDTFTENLETAKNSEGALQAQADIYADSWQAASQRVKAATEEIYDKLLDDEFIVDFLNGLEKVIDTVSKLIDTFGGLKGIILGISSILLNKFSESAAAGLNNLAYGAMNFVTMGRHGQKQAEKAQNEAMSQAEIIGRTGVAGTPTQGGVGVTQGAGATTAPSSYATEAAVSGLKSQIALSREYNSVREKMTESERMTAELILEQNKRLQDQVAAAGAAADQAQKKAQASEANLFGEASMSYGFTETTTAIENMKNKINFGEKIVSELQEASQEFVNGNIKIDEYREKLRQLAMESEQGGFGGLNTRIKNMVGASGQDQLMGMARGITGSETIVGGMRQEIEDAAINSTLDTFNQTSQREGAAKIGADLRQAEEEYMNVYNKEQALIESGAKTGQNKWEEANAALSKYLNTLEQASKKAKELGLTDLGSAIDQEIYSSPGNTRSVGSVAKRINNRRTGNEDLVKDNTKNLRQEDAVSEKTVREAAKTHGEATRAVNNFSKAQKNGEAASKKYQSAIKSMGTSVKSVSQALVGVAQGVAQVSSALSMLTNIGDVITNDDLSPFEKLLSIFTSIGFAVPMIVGGFKAVGGAINGAMNIQKIAIGQDTVRLVGLKTLNQELLNQAMVEGGNTFAAQMSAHATKEQTEEEVKNTIAKQLGISVTAEGAQGELLAAMTARVMAGAKDAETGSVVANTVAWYANPVMWIAAIIIGVIAVIVLLVSAFDAWNKKLAENRQAQIDQAKENLELIESNEKLSESVEKLVEEYKELKTSGEDSYETFKKLKEQIPELIESYEDLAGAMDIDSTNLSKLKQGYDLFKQTGDISMFEEAQKRADLSVTQKKIEQLRHGILSSTEKMFAEARKDGGKRFQGEGYNYLFSAGNDKSGFIGTALGTILGSVLPVPGGPLIGAAIGDATGDRVAGKEENKVRDILAEELGDLYDTESNMIAVDMSNTQEAMQYYERLGKAKAKMMNELSEEELANSEVYQKVKKEFESLEEAYGELSEFQSQLYDVAKEAFAAGEGETYLNEIFNGNIKSLKEYESGLDELYKSIRAKYGDLTDEQVSALLLSSPEFAAMETGRLLFDPESGTIAEQVKLNGKIALDTVKSWWDNLPDDDRVLVGSIDFSNIDSISEAEEKLAELQEQRKKFQIRSEAETLEIDIITLEIYSDILSETNKGLEKNNSLTDQVALNYLKINKAVESLNKTFEDNLEILKEGNRLSPQYAAAVASVQKAVEEAFGVEFGDDSTFVEDNWELLLQFTKGNFNNFAEFQDKMAAERIKAIDPNSFKISSDYGGSYVENAQEYLAYAINQIAVPAERLSVGEEVIIDEEALKNFNIMLAAGQIAKDDLDKIYAEKGFEAEWENGKLTGWLTRTMDIATAQQAFGLSDSDIKNRKKELDNLHEEQRMLNSLGKTYNKISVLKDNAYGADKLKYMAQEKVILEQQLVVMDRQVETLKNNEQQAKLELSSFMAQLQADYSNFNIDLQFDELTGELLNVEEILNLGASEIVSDVDYEKLMELIEGWEGYADSVDDAETELLEMQAQLDNLFTEYINQALEFNIEFRSKGLDHLERVFSKLEDKSFTIADAFTNLTSQATIQMANFNDYETSIRELAKKKDMKNAETGDIATIYSDLLARDDLTDAEASSLYQWYDGMVDASESLEEINARIHEQIIKYFEDIVAEYDKIASKAEEINSAISDYQNIADIVGEGFLGSQLQPFDAKSFAKEMQKASGMIATEQMIAARATQEKLQEDLKEVEAKLAVKGLSDEDKEALNKDVEEIKAMIVEAGQNMRQHWADALQAAADMFATEMEQIAEEFEKNISGSFETLERMAEAFEQKSTLNKQYLTDYKKIYELSKLTRQIESKVNNTASVRAKSMLASLQKEINDMEASGVKMSQYDLEYLQKKYDLKVAEIALEEQQKNKSTVRLTQMADGSWGYVYTQNMDDAEKAMQSYEDALYNAQSTTDEYLNNLGSSIINTQQEAAEAIAAVWADATLTMEEKQDRADELTAYYTAQLEYYTSEYDKAVGNNYQLYNSDWQNFHEMTGKTLGDLDDFNTTFSSTVLGNMMEGVENASKIYDTFVTSLGSVESGDGFIGKLYSSTNDYTIKLNDIMALANTTLDTYAGMATTEILGEDGTGTKSGMVFSLSQLGEQADAIGKKIAALHGSLNESSPVGDATLVALQTALTSWFGSETAEGSFAQDVKEVKDKANEIGNFFMEAATIPKEGLPYLNSITKAIENWRKTALQDAVNAINSTMEGIKTPYDNAKEKFLSKGGKRLTDLQDFGDSISYSAGANRLYEYFLKNNVLSSVEWQSFGIDPATMDRVKSLVESGNSEEAGKLLESSGIGTILGQLAGGTTTGDKKERSASIATDILSNTKVFENGQSAQTLGSTKTGEKQSDEIVVKKLQELFKNSPYISDSKETEEFWRYLGLHWENNGTGVDVKDIFTNNWDKLSRLDKTSYAAFARKIWRVLSEYQEMPEPTDENISDSFTEPVVISYSYEEKLRRAGIVDQALAALDGFQALNSQYQGLFNQGLITVPPSFFDNVQMLTHLSGPLSLEEKAMDVYYMAASSFLEGFQNIIEQIANIEAPATGLPPLPSISLDTGGYTGAWGTDGRLAMLHQKELVLNASDTENMLAAVDILREVVRQIDLQAANSALVANLKAPYTGTSQEVLQQEVNIHAEFPNATNRSEIEEAFKTLINQASQYVNRNRQ